MNEKRHEFLKKSWRFLYFLATPFIKLKFNSEPDEVYVEGPCIVISNHVSSWDPLLLSHSFPRTKLYFVASEHLMRMGILSRLLLWLVDLIPRKKASMGADTVMMCLRHLRAGHAVCLFAEGNASWDGLSDKVFPATGKLVRNSGATLVTFRLEGGYLSAPRWGKGTRRGRVRGHKIGIYSPEELKAMTPAQINDIINRDIYEDAWERQKTEKIAYKGRNTARYIERALFLCPNCKNVGSLKGDGRMLRCSCGYETMYTDYGIFDPPIPFENIAQWDVWQHNAIKEDDFVHGDILFSDEDMSLTEIKSNHEESHLARGLLSMTKDELIFEDLHFSLSDIEMMSIVQAKILLFSCGGRYFEIRANRPSCHRKYLAYWEHTKNQTK